MTAKRRLLATVLSCVALAGCGSSQGAAEKAHERFEALSVDMCKYLGQPQTCKEAERFLETHTLREAHEIADEGR